MTLRLLHVTTVPMSLRFLRGQVGYMQARGFEVHAVCSPGGELEEFGATQGVAVHAVEMPRRITPLRDLAAVGELARTIRRLRPDIVHSHTPKGGLLGMMAAFLARAPVRVYHMRGLPFVTLAGGKRRVLTATERVSCGLAHRVLCVSHSLREVALAEGLCPPGKIRVLGAGSGNGVDAREVYNPVSHGPAARERARREVGIPSGALVVGFVGRLVRDKGIGELAAAWGEMREAHPAAHLLLVGPVEEQDPPPPGVLEALRDDPRVHLAGMQSSAAPWYPAMDLLALPTYREGFPNVLLEAGAMALPVVATRIPGCVDAVVDGVTGTLVAARDAAGLRAALHRYLHDASLREAHGAAARAHVLEKFEQRALWAALEREYLDLVAERAGRARPGEARRAGWT